MELSIFIELESYHLHSKPETRSHRKQSGALQISIIYFMDKSIEDFWWERLMFLNQEEK